MVDIDRFADENYASRDPEYEVENSETELIENDMIYMNSYIRILKEKYPNEIIVKRMAERFLSIIDFIEEHEE